MVDNFTRNINDNRLARVNHNRGKLKRLDTGKQNPKVYASKIAHMWGVVVERAKKIIMATTQNSVWGVTRPIKNIFCTRQEMFRHQKFSGMKYAGTVISGVKSESRNRVAQVYVTYFGDTVIYTLEHRIEAHN